MQEHLTLVLGRVPHADLIEFCIAANDGNPSLADLVTMGNRKTPPPPGYSIVLHNNLMGQFLVTRGRLPSMEEVEISHEYYDYEHRFPTPDEFTTFVDLRLTMLQGANDLEDDRALAASVVCLAQEAKVRETERLATVTTLLVSGSKPYKRPSRTSVPTQPPSQSNQSDYSFTLTKRQKCEGKTLLSTDTHASPSDSSICSICLGDLCDDDKVVEVSCGHIFHLLKETEGCLGLQGWIQSSNECPVCRKEIIDSQQVKCVKVDGTLVSSNSPLS